MTGEYPHFSQYDTLEEVTLTASTFAYARLPEMSQRRSISLRGDGNRVGS
jgi:hypothetical protein